MSWGTRCRWSRMGKNTGDHAIQREECRYLDKKRGLVNMARGCRVARPGPNTSNFNVVCPSNKECRVVLPRKSTFEEVGSWTINRAIDKGYARLGDIVIDLNTLLLRSQVASFIHKSRTYEIVRPRNQPTLPSYLPDRAFAGM